jgi:hypothetical protein
LVRRQLEVAGKFCRSGEGFLEVLMIEVLTDSEELVSPESI